MSNMVRQTFDIEKNFYKVNYINEHPHLIIPPSEEEITRIDHFISDLKAGDRVDVLKGEMHTKRLCWLPGTIKKVSSLSIHVVFDYEKGSYTFDRRSMQVVPAESKKSEY